METRDDPRHKHRNPNQSSRMPTNNPLRLPTRPVRFQRLFLLAAAPRVFPTIGEAADSARVACLLSRGSVLALCQSLADGGGPDAPRYSDTTRIRVRVPERLRPLSPSANRIPACSPRMRGSEPATISLRSSQSEDSRRRRIGCSIAQSMPERSPGLRSANEVFGLFRTFHLYLRHLSKT